MSTRVPATGGTRCWEPAPARADMREDEVHVWGADLDRPAWPLAQLARGLSPDELVRADSFVFPRDRRRFIAARGMLRWLLCGYFDCEPRALALRDGRNGKPELATPSGSPPVQFNYSRSQGGALYAVTRGRQVGVDLEALRPVPDAEQIARRWFSPRERAALTRLPDEQRDKAFLRAWTSKEAYTKAVGVGIASGLDRIEVALALDQPPELRAIDGDPVAAAGWSMPEPPPVPGYAAAVVVEAHSYSLRCWSLVPRSRHPM